MDPDRIRVRVDDGSFLLSNSGRIALETLDFATSLIATMDVGAVFSTGIHTGHIRVRAETFARRPTRR